MYLHVGKVPDCVSPALSLRVEARFIVCRSFFLKCPLPLRRKTLVGGGVKNGLSSYNLGAALRAMHG